MKISRTSRIVGLLAAGALLASGGYWFGTRSTGHGDGTEGAAATSSGVDSGKRVLYWHDPMVPGKRFDKPGKSPFMDMQLVPVHADAGGEAASVRISPTLQQNLGIRFAKVRREDAADTLDLVGSTQFDASSEEVVQSRSAGFIDRLYVRSPQQRIERGQAVASVFVPEWAAPQEEYLALVRGGDASLAGAARQRMRALSIPDSLVAELERTRRVQTHHTLRSPVSGIVSELDVREGAQVTPGMTIAKVVAMRTLWLVAEVPETLLGAARPGMRVSASFAGDAHRTYQGKVREILPGVNPATRTAQARLELDNREGRLIPGLLMRVRLSSSTPRPRLLVPTEAIIASGKRSVVLVADGDERMRPVVVTTGQEIGDDTEILAGVEAGQKVVASGQFLIDSEASLKAILPKLLGDTGEDARPGGRATAAPKTHTGVGKVEKITDTSVTLSHEPIPSLQWPSMTMDFNKPRGDTYEGIDAGQVVEFEFVEGEKGYDLKKLAPAKGAKP